jgi:hypothetical protein
VVSRLVPTPATLSPNNDLPVPRTAPAVILASRYTDCPIAAHRNKPFLQPEKSLATEINQRRTGIKKVAINSPLNIRVGLTSVGCKTEFCPSFICTGESHNSLLLYLMEHNKIIEFGVLAALTAKSSSESPTFQKPISRQFHIVACF